MEYRLSVIVCQLLFFVVDLVILQSIQKYKAASDRHRSFSYFAACVTVQQGFALITQSIWPGLWVPGSLVSYLLYMGVYISIMGSSYECYRYLRALICGDDRISGVKLVIARLPLIVMTAAVLSAPWTHLIFYIGEDGLYRRGALFLLQGFLPYSYILMAAVMALMRIKEGGREHTRRMLRYFLLFFVPSMVCTVIQLTLVAGGYTATGISIGLIMMYLELYIEEVSDNRRLRSEEALMELFNALSRDYLNVYLLDPERNLVRILKLNGYVTEGITSEKREYPYDALCGQYIRDRVYEPDVQMMTRVMSVDNLLKELASEEQYVGTYRVYENKEIHYYQYKYVRSRGTNPIIAGFQNVDNMIASMQQQQEVLRQALQEAEEANAAKTIFLNNMSHDIRTPMNAIMGYTELMDRHEGDRERFRDYLNKIRNAGSFLLSLINNVLEMARIESGQMTLSETPICMRRSAEELNSVFAEQMKTKNITFTQVFEIRTPCIYGDRVKLNEIFLNLISNAFKYTPEGGSITTVLRELPCEREGWTILQTIVSDSGIGMSLEFQAHMFEYFSRERNVTEGKIEGTGLGLPIVKKLVEMMNGSIRVTSEPGKGTSFEVTIPHRIAEQPDQAAAGGSITAPESFAGKRILLAEDNDLNAEIATELLTDLGFTVARAADGAVCVDMLAGADAGFYDLILMDILMPEMDGYQAAVKIRSMPDRAKAGIPIIALTANAFDEDRLKALDAGMNAHLSKPIEPSKLKQTLADILQNRTAE